MKYASRSLWIMSLRLLPSFFALSSSSLMVFSFMAMLIRVLRSFGSFRRKVFHFL